MKRAIAIIITVLFLSQVFGAIQWIDGRTIENQIEVKDMAGGSDLSQSPVTRAEDGPVAQWHMDEGTGTNVSDSSGNGNHGTLNVGGGDNTEEKWTNGVNGKALTFDGEDDYVEVSDNDILDQNVFSVEAWINTSAVSDTFCAIVEKGYTEFTNGGFILSMTNEQKAGFSIVKSSSYQGCDSNVRINDGKWHQIVGVRVSNSLVKIYVDGKLENQDTRTTAVDISNSNSLFIGCRKHTAPYGYIDGIIDKVSIYNRTLSEEEIEDRYGETLGAIVDISVSSQDIVLSNPKPDAGENVRINATIINKGNEGITFEDDFEQNNLWNLEQTTGGGFSITLSEDQNNTGKSSIKMTGNDNLGTNGYARISRDINLSGINRVRFSFRNGQNFMLGARSLAYWLDGSITVLEDMSYYGDNRWYNLSVDTSQKQGVHTISLGIFKSGGYIFSDISFYFDTVLGYEGIEATVSFYDGFPERGGEAIKHEEIVFLGEKNIETSVEWTASEGRHDIVVMVKDVEPEDEKLDNNLAMRVINVPGDMPDISINGLDILLSDDNPQVGNMIRIDGIVRNLGGNYYPQWWYPNWQYREFLIIDNTQNEAVLTNYSVSLEVEHLNGMKDDFSDIRFADLHGNELNYWIENMDVGQKATVWFKVDEIPAIGRTQALLYYGNEDAESASSPDGVFEVYDDFDSNDIDGKKWGCSENGGVSIGILGGNLELRLNSASLGDSASISSKKLFTYPVVWEARVTTTSSNPVGSYAPAMGLHSDPGTACSCIYSYHNQIHIKNAEGNSYNPVEHNAFSNNWKTASIIWDEDFADFLVDGQTKLHATEYIPSSPMACFFSISCDQAGGSNNKYIKVDWVKVRRYTPVSPTVTLRDERGSFTANVTLFDGNPDTDGEIIGYNNISGWNGDDMGISFNWTPMKSGPNELFMRIGEIKPADATDSNNMAQWTVEVLPEDRAPQFVSPIADFSIPEDDEGIDMLNLGVHFEDINVPRSLLNFTLIPLSQVRNIEGRIEGSNVSFSSNLADWYGEESFIINCSNGLGLWTVSNIFNVTVNPINDPPNAWMISPKNGQTLGITEILFSWNASDVDDIPNNITFDLYLDESDPPRLHTSDIDGYNFTINDLKDDTKYYWYVRPHDGKTKGACLNNTWNFTINSSAQLPEVEHILPKNGAIINGSVAVLSWKLVSSVGNNIRYEVLFGSSKDDLQISDTVSSTYYNLSDLVDNTTYYWKIIPFSDMLRGKTGSGVWEFTVQRGFVAEYSIEWSAKKQSLVIEEGQSVLSFNVSVKNKGNTINSISIRSSGELAGKISFSSTNMELYPGETEDTIVTIITSSLAKGKYTILIELHHRGGSEIIEFPLTVQVVRGEGSTDNEGMNTGLLIGITAVVLIGVVIIVVIIVVKRRRKDDTDEFEEVESDAIEADIVAPLVEPPQKGVDRGYPAATMEYPGGQIENDYYCPPTAPSGMDATDAQLHFNGWDESQHTLQQGQGTDAEIASGFDLSGLHLPYETPSVDGQGAREKILALPPARILNVEKEKQKVPIDELFLMTPSGLLVQHYSLKRESGLNEDVLAGMLTAVKSFILDSLSMVGEKSVEDRDMSIDLGKFSVMMAAGKSLNLVAITNRENKEMVRKQLEKGLHVLELIFGDIMADWDGDMSKIEGVKPYIESMVKGKFDDKAIKEMEKQLPPKDEAPPLASPPEKKPELPSGRRTVTVSLPGPVQVPDTTKALPESSEALPGSPPDDSNGSSILSTLEDILTQGKDAPEPTLPTPPLPAPVPPSSTPSLGTGAPSETNAPPLLPESSKAPDVTPGVPKLPDKELPPPSR